MAHGHDRTTAARTLQEIVFKNRNNAPRISSHSTYELHSFCARSLATLFLCTVPCGEDDLHRHAVRDAYRALSPLDVEMIPAPRTQYAMLVTFP
jgi:hypothetical protein